MSYEGFIQHIKDEPLYLPAIAFTGGFIGGAILTKQFTNSPMLIILGGLGGGTATTYGEYLVYTSVTSIAEKVKEKAEEIIDEIKDKGEEIFIDTGLSEGTQWDVRAILNYLMANFSTPLASQEDAPIPETLTANQAIVLGIMRTFTLQQIADLLRDLTINYNGYHLTIPILTKLASDGGATIDGVDTPLTTVAASNIVDMETGDLEHLTDNKIVSDEYGGRLLQDYRITSPNGAYYAVLQNDGNLVIYRDSISRPAIWASESHTRDPPVSLIMQSDGNLVIYNKDGHGVWATETAGRGTGPYTLSLEDDAELKIVDSRGTLIWSNNKSVPIGPQPTDNKLISNRFGGVLNQGDQLNSPNFVYFLVLQDDGNLVIYYNYGNTIAGLWASRSSTDDPPVTLVMQPDGNLVMYDRNHGAVWYTQTSGRGIGPFTLSIENDGELKIVDSRGTKTWSNNVHRPVSNPGS